MLNTTPDKNIKQCPVCKCGELDIARLGAKRWLPLPPCFKPVPGMTFSSVVCPACEGSDIRIKSLTLWETLPAWQREKFKFPTINHLPEIFLDMRFLPESEWPDHFVHGYYGIRTADCGYRQTMKGREYCSWLGRLKPEWLKEFEPLCTPAQLAGFKLSDKVNFLEKAPRMVLSIADTLQRETALTFMTANIGPFPIK